MESMLRSISAHVKPEEAGVKLSRVTKTKEGDLVLKVREYTPGGGATFAEIIRKNSSLEVDVRDATGPMITVVLRDIDPLLDAKSIENTLKAILGLPDGCKIRTEDPRLNKYRWQCLIGLPRPAAKALLRHKRLQLGGTWCRPEEWVTLPTCFKCQNVGHLAKDCKKDQVDGPRCYKCGELGHTSKNCQKTSTHCHVCEVDGHTASSMACPIYKQLVKAHKQGVREEAARLRALAESRAEALDKKLRRKEARRTTTDAEGWTHTGTGDSARVKDRTETATPNNDSGTV